jgi:uncharacterized OB-fold protein
MTPLRLVDAALFASNDPLTLAGSRCAACGTTTFPVQTACPRCFGEDLEPIPLATHGHVWSWTVQHFAPKPPYRVDPDGFTPFCTGYVDLGNVIVQTRLDFPPTDPPTVGVAVTLVALPAYVDDDGAQVVTFAFAPERSERGAGS